MGLFEAFIESGRRKRDARNARIEADEKLAELANIQIEIAALQLAELKRHAKEQQDVIDPENAP